MDHQGVWAGPEIPLGPSQSHSAQTFHSFLQQKFDANICPETQGSRSEGIMLLGMTQKRKPRA